MKQVTHIDPLSTAKIASLLGILWAVLGWLFSGIVISLLVAGSSAELSDVPQSFSIGGLAAGIIGGFVGGAVSGYLGSVVYNLLAAKFGGIKVEMRDMAVVQQQPPMQ